jgi:hypothetical protein
VTHGQHFVFNHNPQLAGVLGEDLVERGLESGALSAAKRRKEDYRDRRIRGTFTGIFGV